MFIFAVFVTKVICDCGFISDGLLLRLSSVDDNIRLASLTVFKHLITSSLEEVRPRMKDIFDALHSKLSESSSNRVKSMLAQLTALLGRVGYLEGDEKGKDFLEFIVKLCALQIQPGPDEVRYITSRQFFENSCQFEGA